MIRKAVCIAFMLIALPIAAQAGGSTVGNGGVSILCFDRPASEFVVNSALKPGVSEHIVSAVTLEYYLASQRDSFKPERYQMPSAIAAIDALKSRLAEVPEFFLELQKISGLLGPIDNGIPARNGLRPTEDKVNPLVLPDHCAEVQTVVRRRDQMYFDSQSWDALQSLQSGIQSGFLQVHEEVYELAVAQDHADSSIDTQLLMVSLLSDELNRWDIMAKLQEYGFGDFRPFTRCDLRDPAVIPGDTPKWITLNEAQGRIRSALITLANLYRLGKPLTPEQIHLANRTIVNLIDTTLIIPPKGTLPERWPDQEVGGKLRCAAYEAIALFHAAREASGSLVPTGIAFNALREDVEMVYLPPGF